MSSTASIHSLVQSDPARAESVAWAQFTAPATVTEFHASWLSILCAQMAQARGALLLLRDEADSSAGGSYVAAAVWPDASHPMQYLAPAATRALQERRGVLVGADGTEPPGRDQPVHMAYPIDIDGELHGAVVVHLAPGAEAELQRDLRLAHWGTAWLVDQFRQRHHALELEHMQRLGLLAEALATAVQDPGLGVSCVATVNDLAQRLGCERVSVGLDNDGEIRVQALSNTATFDARSNLVRLLSDAMDEVLDLDTALVYPPPDGDELGALAHAELARETGSTAICSVPLVDQGLAIGVLSFERAQPFAPATLETCKALGLALGPVLALKQANERSQWRRTADHLRHAGVVMFGPGHPGAKLIGLVVVGLLLVLGLFNADHRVSARTVVEGAVQRAAVAPFNGYVIESLVRAGDTVRQGQVLARLDDRDLQLEQARWAAELQQLQGKQRQAMAAQDRTSMMLAGAQIEQAQAQLSLVESRLARASLQAPFDGVVVTGDLHQLLGTPVDQGKVLFEIAPLDAYRVILQVDERDISHLQPGQTGELALSGLPGQTLAFSVKQITPVTTAEDGRNHFRVEAQVHQASERLRPGMEGVGKVRVGERRLLWIWTHRFVDWLRLAFWNWLP